MVEEEEPSETSVGESKWEAAEETSWQTSWLNQAKEGVESGALEQFQEVMECVECQGVECQWALGC